MEKGTGNQGDFGTRNPRDKRGQPAQVLRSQKPTTFLYLEQLFAKVDPGRIARQFFYSSFFA